MKLSLRSVAMIALSAVTIGVVAKEVKDWKDLHNAHEKVKHAIEDLARARASNHYDFQGHMAKAEELLKQSEQEMKIGIEVVEHEKP